MNCKHSHLIVKYLPHLKSLVVSTMLRDHLALLPLSELSKIKHFGLYFKFHYTLNGQQYLPTLPTMESFEIKNHWTMTWNEKSLSSDFLHRIFSYPKQLTGLKFSDLLKIEKSLDMILLNNPKLKELSLCY